MAYKELQYDRQEAVLKSHPELFEHDKGYGVFQGEKRSFAVENGLHNLFEPIRSKAIQYFKENKISWWKGDDNEGVKGPTTHMLSSQIACLNHLFAIKDDADVVLSLVNHLRPGVSFSRVIPIDLDKDPAGYIAFEVVSKGRWLNERTRTRGSQCTSVDALIIGEKDNGERWLIPIEWKYTEVYNLNDDKSQEDRDNEPKGSNGRGLTRLKNYSDLITESSYLQTVSPYIHSIYFFEPFYQLMRQTLWAEQMIKHRDEEWVRADKFLHIHIIPAENKDLLDMAYLKTGKGMEESWRSQLLQDIYQIINPEALLSPLKGNSKYSDLINYLTIRYW